MKWLFLFGAIFLDVFATYALDASHGFHRRAPAVLGSTAFLVMLYLYALALTGIRPPIAYAVFGAVGTTATATVGLALGVQPRNWLSAVALTLIIAGVVLLPLAGSES